MYKNAQVENAFALCRISTVHQKELPFTSEANKYTPEFILSVPHWKPLLCDSYLFLHLSFRSYIHLPFHLCIYSLFLILPFSVPVFQLLTISASVTRFIYVSLLFVSVLILWQCTLHAPHPIWWREWDGVSDCQMKSKSFFSPPLCFSCKECKPHWLWTCLRNGFSVLWSSTHAWPPFSFSAPHLSLFSPHKVYFCQKWTEMNVQKWTSFTS